jgi:hypothetical protein
MLFPKQVIDLSIKTKGDELWLELKTNYEFICESYASDNCNTILKPLANHCFRLSVSKSGGPLPRENALA